MNYLMVKLRKIKIPQFILPPNVSRPFSHPKEFLCGIARVQRGTPFLNNGTINNFDNYPKF